MQKGEATSCGSYFQDFPYSKNITPHKETSEQKKLANEQPRRTFLRQSLKPLSELS